MQNNTPQFSIVIPTYNHGHLIRKCLDSLIAQTYINWEAIIVNNFSSDNTVEIIEGYNEPRFRLINFSNGGVIAASRNVGIKNAKSEWICFLDSDDWWYQNKLEVIVTYIGEHDFLYHDLRVYNNNGHTKIIKRCRKLESNCCLDLLVNRNGINNSSVVVKKKIIEQAGYLNEDKRLVAMEDYDLWIRVAMLTDKFYCISEELGGYFIGAGNISANYSKRNEIESYIFKKYQNLIPDNLLPLAITNLNMYFAINYILANDIKYIKALYIVFKYGSNRNKIRALYYLFFGHLYIKVIRKSSFI